jgi:hypothetical protein
MLLDRAPKGQSDAKPIWIFAKILQDSPVEGRADLVAPTLHGRVIVCEIGYVQPHSRELRVGFAISQRGQSRKLLRKPPSAAQGPTALVTFDGLHQDTEMPTGKLNDLIRLTVRNGRNQPVGRLADSTEVQQTLA